MAPLRTTGDDAKRYLGAWGEISRAMELGTSWSGNERNVAWVNMRDGSFADVSAVAGLDQIEDGRVALPCDWDRDGDYTDQTFDDLVHVEIWPIEQAGEQA